MLIVAVLHAAGILLADALSLPPAGLIASALATGIAALLLPRARPGLLGLLLFLAGAAHLAWITTPWSPHDLRRVVGEEAIIVTVRGRLVDTPHHRHYAHGEEMSTRSLGEVEVEALARPDGMWRPAVGRVMTSTSGALPPRFHGGSRVEIEGVLQVPRPPVAPGQFDYGRYLRRNGIHFQLQVESTNDWRLAPGVAQPARPPLSDRFIHWAQATLGRGLPEDDSLRLLWAMTLGWKTALTGEVSEPFMRSGTMHVFAISGLHIALIAGILVMVVRAVRIPSHAAAWVVIPLIWFYTHATGWQASAVRSTVMMSVILAGGALRRPSDLLNSLALAAFLILLWEPRQLFQAGFQLSFSVVFTLALFGPAVRAWREAIPGGTSDPGQRAGWIARLPWLRAWFPDPLLPGALQPRWHRWVRLPGRWLRQAFATSLAAWIGSIPLVAYYFNLFTPVSLVANLLVVPLSSAALAANLASLAVGGWAPGLGELFNHAAWCFMGAMAALSQWAAAWPGACAHVATPGWPFLALYYSTLLACLTGTLHRPRWRAASVITLAALAFLWGAQRLAERQTTRLTILPLHGGDAVCLDQPGTSGDLMVDCGDGASAAFVVKPFLRSQGINRLAVLALTHGDIRHVGGAGFLQREFRIDELLLSPVAFRSTAYRGVQAEESPGRTVTRQYALGERLGPWTVLHPGPADRHPQADDNALVLGGELRGTRFLLLSDLGKRGQNALLERATAVRADIVVSGLPVRGEPLADDLLAALQPAVVIVTDSLYPATARANRRLRTRLGEHPFRVLYTSETGGLTILLRDGRWSIRTAAGRVVAEGSRPE